MNVIYIEDEYQYIKNDDPEKLMDAISEKKEINDILLYYAMENRKVKCLEVILYCVKFGNLINIDVKRVSKISYLVFATYRCYTLGFEKVIEYNLFNKYDIDKSFRLALKMKQNFIIKVILDLSLTYGDRYSNVRRLTVSTIKKHDYNSLILYTLDLNYIENYEENFLNLINSIEDKDFYYSLFMALFTCRGNYLGDYLRYFNYVEDPNIFVRPIEFYRTQKLTDTLFKPIDLSFKRIRNVESKFYVIFNKYIVEGESNKILNMNDNINEYYVNPNIRNVHCLRKFFISKYLLDYYVNDTFMKNSKFFYYIMHYCSHFYFEISAYCEFVNILEYMKDKEESESYVSLAYEIHLRTRCYEFKLYIAKIIVYIVSRSINLDWLYCWDHMLFSIMILGVEMKSIKNTKQHRNLLVDHLITSKNSTNLNFVKYLVDYVGPKKCNESSYLNRYNTPLHIAASLSEDLAEQVINYLISQGAHTDILNEYGNLPVDFASTNKISNILKSKSNKLKCICAHSIIKNNIVKMICNPHLKKYVADHVPYVSF